MKPIEFRLRPNEKGLSLFEFNSAVQAKELIERIRALGKQGELAAAVIDRGVLQSLGLKLVRTPANPGIESSEMAHFEARLSFPMRLVLLVRGLPVMIISINT